MRVNRRGEGRRSDVGAPCPTPLSPWGEGPGVRVSGGAGGAPPQPSPSSTLTLALSPCRERGSETGLRGSCLRRNDGTSDARLKEE